MCSFTISAEAYLETFPDAPAQGSAQPPRRRRAGVSAAGFAFQDDVAARRVCAHFQRKPINESTVDAGAKSSSA
jgi:hypothetical protein